MIYFTQDSTTLHVKIGHTAGDEAETRRKALQTGNPSELVVLATMPGERADETALHQRFAAARVAGEWFRPVPALLLLIGEAQKQAAPPFDVTPPSPAGSALRFYLAGKMRSDSWKRFDCWRTSILSPQATDGMGSGQFVTHESPSDLAALPVLEGVVFGRHDYVGPCYFDCVSGHARWRDGEHGCNDSVYVGEPRGDLTRQTIRRLCLDAIRRADVVFAWLDSLDCYGTLAEIGYAHAVGRKIWVASPEPLPDLWLAFGMADWGYDRASTPLDAFSRALAWDAARTQMHAAARKS